LLNVSGLWVTVMVVSLDCTKPRHLATQSSVIRMVKGRSQDQSNSTESQIGWFPQSLNSLNFPSDKHD
jgi:hypothetical protein